MRLDSPETPKRSEQPGSEMEQHLGVTALGPKTELGPDSLLWHYAGDWRIGFTGLSAGVLQLMHPAIGAGIAEHSDFFNEPWGRIYCSIPEIIGSVYDTHPEDTGHRVRDYHKGVKGMDEAGRRYHALNPETFWWAHATFQKMIEAVPERFGRRDLTPEQYEQLYQEGVEWYKRYGVSARPVPETREEFEEKWDYICDEVLEMTPAAQAAVDMAANRNVQRIPGVPSFVWMFGRIPVSEMARIITIGGLPQKVRERFDIQWSSLDQLALTGLEVSVRNSWKFVLPSFRYHPRARAGNRQARLAA